MGGEFTYQPKWDPKTVLTTTLTSGHRSYCSFLLGFRLDGVPGGHAAALRAATLRLSKKGRTGFSNETVAGWAEKRESARKTTTTVSSRFSAALVGPVYLLSLDPSGAKASQKKHRAAPNLLKLANNCSWGSRQQFTSRSNPVDSFSKRVDLSQGRYNGDVSPAALI